MLPRTLLAVVFLVLPSLSVFAEDKPAGHKHALFNGKNLDGFIIENDCKASVKDGMILVEAGNGWLRHQTAQTDFKLHVEWKSLKKDKYDAGIYIRTPKGAGKPFPRGGYQINLLQGKEGNIGNLKGAASKGLIKPGEWNTFDITVIGDSVELTINGKKAYKVKGIKNPTGFVGIQCEVPLGGQFLIRKFDLTELTHKTLFNGVDLTGWEGAGRPASDCWTVQDGELVCLKKKARG